MKKTQIKDALRNVRKQKISYLSIIIIAMIGVTTFLGIDYTSSSMRANGSDVYNKLNYRDIEVVSTMMFTGEDIEEVLKIEGVADVEPILFTSGKAEAGGEIIDADAVSLSERINLVDTVEGVLPAAAGECAAERWAAEKYGIKCGDRITLTDSDGNTARFLSEKEFTVTAIVDHPDHLNKIVATVPYILLTEDAFDKDATGGSYMKLEILTVRKANADRFSKSYTESTAKILEKLEDLGYIRADLRDKDQRGAYQQEIDENREKLEDAARQLEEARRLLDEKAAEILDAEQRLKDAETQLAEAQTKIADGKKELEEARATLDKEGARLSEGKEKLDEAAEKIAEAKAELTDGLNQLEAAKSVIRATVKAAYEKAFPGDKGSRLIEWAEPAEIDIDKDDAKAAARYLWITDNVRIDLDRSAADIASTVIDSGMISDDLLVALYEAATSKEAPKKHGEYDFAKIKKELLQFISDSDGKYGQLTDGVSKWESGYEEYKAGYEEYRKGLEEYEAGKALLDEAEEKYEKGLEDYEKGVAEYNENKEKFDRGVEELEDGKAKIAEGEQSYADAERDYNDGKEKIEKAQKDLDGVDPCRWIAYDCRGNAGFVQLSNGSGSFLSLKSTFSLLFIIVGALVIFATVGKMVDEQRKLVGTTKALGFFNYEIFAKYLGFGVSASLIGVILGIAAARFGLAPFILGTFDKYYVFNMNIPRFNVLSTLIVVAAAILLAAFSVWLASVKLLREPAVRLMQPKMPGANNRYGKKSSLPLYTRLILLNMRTDLKRVTVTVVSVAGCCALIVTGITLRGAIVGSLDRQYGDVVDYDIAVRFDPEASEHVAEEIEGVLKTAKTEFTGVCSTNVTYRITELQAAELICGDIDEINKFHHLADPATGKALFATNEGVLIQKRTSETYGLAYGDRFDVALGGTKTARVRVGGVFENYIGRMIVISEDYFRAVFEEEPVKNTFLVRLCGADADRLSEELHKIDGFEKLTRSDEDRSMIEASTSTINGVVALFIFIAAIMAGVVLFNLTNMYILQKKQELVIMRINGFTVKEVIGYVLRETFLTTALGIVIGVGAGALIAYRIVRSMEQIFLQFDRSLNPTAWLIAAVITVLFTAAVNALVLRKVKHFKLTDAA